MSLQLILTIGIIGLCMTGLGVGVLFFGKTAERKSCKTLNEEACISQKAGLCPIEDLSGALLKAKQSQISYQKDE